MAQQGLYNTHGEAFGYVVGDKVFNLDSNLMGEIRRAKKRRGVYSLDGELMWKLSGDGIYSLDWEPLGYLGSPNSEQQDF